MREKEILIANGVKLYSNAAIEFVQKAGQFKSKVWIKKEHLMVSAKSLLGILSLRAEAGNHITIIADGCDPRGDIFLPNSLISSGFSFL